ncbi:MAG TPA: peptidylprolyl isomerase [bacterium]|nr:peptidylprolyl isomerase [bacterium]
MEKSLGEIVIKLDAEAAPATVKNFLNYCRNDYYEGTVFHRVIPGFMIQGGGLTPDLQKKTTQDPIRNEADNGLKNERGTIAMARTRDPHSATSQFFINLQNNQQLNFTAKNKRGWGYCVFGEVTDGMDIVDQIAGTKTGAKAGRQNVPVDDIIIKKVELKDDNIVVMTIVKKTSEEK